MTFAPEDFDPPSTDASDHVLALRAVIDAKGATPPKPPVCHGFANCCKCPACLLGPRRLPRSRRHQRAKEPVAA